MKITDEEKGQGATEYLLMLAAALVGTGIAIHYVTQTADTATSTGENEVDNIENMIG